MDFVSSSLRAYDRRVVYSFQIPEDQVVVGDLARHCPEDHANDEERHDQGRWCDSCDIHRIDKGLNRLRRTQIFARGC